MTIRVGVLGFGVIGKRAAWAIGLQPDMELEGVGARRSSSSLRVAEARGTRVFCAGAPCDGSLESAGIRVAGNFADLLAASDVIIDCGSRGTAAHRKPIYEFSQTRVVYCGGERAEVVGPTFVTSVNFQKLRGSAAVKVGSCNTVAASRVLRVFQREYGLQGADLSIVRCGSDPDKASRGPVGDFEVEPGPSHHADDLRTLFIEAEFHTRAVTVGAITVMSFLLALRRGGNPTAGDVVARLRATPRIELESGSEVTTLAAFRHRAREAGRPRGDRPEVTVWADSVTCRGNSTYLTAAVHMEAVTIPELVDAVRVVHDTKMSAAASALRTDSALRIARDPEVYVGAYGSNTSPLDARSA